MPDPDAWRLSAYPKKTVFDDTDLLLMENADETDEKISLKDLRNEINGLRPATQTPQAEAATTTFVAADFDQIITNTGAGGAVVYTLPAASAVKGQTMRVAVTVAQLVTLDPVAADAVWLNGSGVDNKDLIIAGVIGNYVDLFSNGVDFEVVGYSGVVTKEA